MNKIRAGFLNMLSSLRKKSDNEKLFISVGTALVLTIAIASVAYGLPDTKETPVVTDQSLSDISVFANIKNEFAETISSVKQGVAEIGKLKETISDSASAVSTDTVEQIEEDLNSLTTDVTNL